VEEEKNKLIFSRAIRINDEVYLILTQGIKFEPEDGSLGISNEEQEEPPSSNQSIEIFNESKISHTFRKSNDSQFQQTPKIQQNNEIENPENIDDYSQKEESEINQADFSHSFGRSDVAQFQLILRNIQVGDDSPSSEVEKPANIDDRPLCEGNSKAINIHMNPLKTEDDAFVSEPEHSNPHLDECVLTDIFQFAHDINCAIEGNVNSSGDVFEYNDFNLINAFTQEHPQFKFSQLLHNFF
jgi:hypothetical protein